MTDKKTITKEELLKMPESKYMNQQQLDFFESLLLEQAQEIELSVQQAKEALANSEQEIDLNDVATKQEMQQLHLRTMERQGKLINKVKQSIMMIRKGSQGDYGYCFETGEPIGLQRLLARPTATLSIQSKQAQEHQERTIGTSEIKSYKAQDDDDEA
jgi:DnaK suppressor protein